MGCTESKDKSQSQKPVDTAATEAAKAAPQRDAAQAELKAKGKQATVATLIEATRAGDLELVKLCLNAGVDPNEQESDSLQRSALQHAALKGHEAIVTYLLENKASPMQTDSIGETAMHQAAAGSHPGVITILAKYGIEKYKEDLVNKRDNHGKAPIFNTIYGAEEKGGATFEALIQCGADVNARDRNKATPLHCAVNKNKRSTITQLLIRHGADVNAQDEFGATPLHRAAQEESTNLIAILLTESADPWIKDNDGRTPLDVAKRWGFTKTAEILEKRM